MGPSGAGWWYSIKGLARVMEPQSRFQIPVEEITKELYSFRHCSNCGLSCRLESSLVLRKTVNLCDSYGLQASKLP